MTQFRIMLSTSSWNSSTVTPSLFMTLIFSKTVILLIFSMSFSLHWSAFVSWLESSYASCTRISQNCSRFSSYPMRWVMISHPIIDDVNLDHLIKSLVDFSTVKSPFFHSNLQFFHLFMYRNMDLQVSVFIQWVVIWYHHTLLWCSVHPQ